MKRFFKTSMVGLSIILGIATNAESTTKCASDHQVNKNVFQHDVVIDVIDGAYSYYAPKKKTYVLNDKNILVKPELADYYNSSTKFYQACEDDSDEYKDYNDNCHYSLHCRINEEDDNTDYEQRDNEFKYKFNKLYEDKKYKGLEKDAKSCFESAVPRIFGNGYKFIKNWGYDIEAAYPEKRIKLKTQNGSEKEFTAYHEMTKLRELENFLKQNGLEKVYTIEYEWKGTARNDQNEEKEFDITSIRHNLFEGENIILISNGNNVIYYNFVKKNIIIYHKIGSRDVLFNGDDNKIIESFNKLGLLLQEKFEIEEELIRKIIDPNATLYYKKQQDQE